MNPHVGDTVVFISHTHDMGTYKVGSHHLARELARQGYRVTHISTPYSVAHDLIGSPQPRRKSLALAGPLVDDDGVTHVVPRTVLPAQYGGDGYLRTALDATGSASPRYVFVDQPLMVGRWLSTVPGIHIYRPTDIYPHGRAARMQNAAIARFAGVVATSRSVLDSLPIVPGQPRMTIPNGVEFARFGEGAESAAHDRSGVAYVGAMDHRFDWQAVTTLAASAPDLRFTLAGDVRSPPPGLPDNVHLVGALAYEDVPDLLRSHRVGVLPFNDAVENSGRSPMKLYEYLAAGLSVVSRDIPAVGGVDAGVHLYSDASGAPIALRRALSGVAPNVRGVEVARRQDWAAKADELISFARGVEQRSRIRTEEV